MPVAAVRAEASLSRNAVGQAEQRRRVTCGSERRGLERVTPTEVPRNSAACRQRTAGHVEVCNGIELESGLPRSTELEKGEAIRKSGSGPICVDCAASLRRGQSFLHTSLVA